MSNELIEASQPLSRAGRQLSGRSGSSQPDSARQGYGLPIAVSCSWKRVELSPFFGTRRDAMRKAQSTPSPLAGNYRYRRRASLRRLTGSLSSSSNCMSCL